MKVRRKDPLVMEAIQWTGENRDDVSEFVKDSEDDYVCDVNSLEISALESTFRAPVGNWIVRGMLGRYYSLSAMEFERAYEVVHG